MEGGLPLIMTAGTTRLVQCTKARKPKDLIRNVVVFTGAHRPVPPEILLNGCKIGTEEDNYRRFGSAIISWLSLVVVIWGRGGNLIGCWINLELSGV